MSKIPPSTYLLIKYDKVIGEFNNLLEVCYCLGINANIKKDGGIEIVFMGNSSKISYNKEFTEGEAIKDFAITTMKKMIPNHYSIMRCIE